MDIDKIIANQKSFSNESQHTAKGKYGMAASAAREATEAGAKVLEEGGTAVDAVAAMQFALAVTEGMNTGLGASGFLTVYDSEKDETWVLDGHSKAPEGAVPELFLDENGEEIPYVPRSLSAKAVGIPGILRTMEIAVNRFGRKKISELIQPAVELAENGIRVNWFWESAIEMMRHRMDDRTKALFMPDGIPLVEGDHIKQPDLAKTLRILQEKGIDAFYEGEIADAIIDVLQSRKGIMTKKDLRNFEVFLDKPIYSKYKGMQLAAPSPPNGGGLSLAQLLGIIEQHDIGQYGVNSWQKYFLLGEAMRIVFSDKLAYVGDPDFLDVPMDGLLNEEYIKKRSELIDFSYRNPDVEFGNPWAHQEGDPDKEIVHEPLAEKGETTHFTAVDRWGNVAACTSSLEHKFGSGIMVPGYGFLLNNDLTDFSPEPNSINGIQPNKHGVSTKSPSILFNEGKPFLTLGSPGGPTIVASVLQVIIHLLDYEMDLKEAIEEPRIYNSIGRVVQWDSGIPQEVRDKMLEKGFHFPEFPKHIGNVQAILIDQERGEMYGAAQSSRPGAAIGLN